MQSLRSVSVYGMAFQQHYLPLRRHGRKWRQLIDGKLGDSHRISLAAVNLSDDDERQLAPRFLVSIEQMWNRSADLIECDAHDRYGLR
jgi:hypothetical protein